MTATDNDDIKNLRMQHDAGADTLASTINGQACIVKTLGCQRAINSHGLAAAMMRAMPDVLARILSVTPAHAAAAATAAAAAAAACRPGCAACCTAPSISSAIPGMPLGKPAGIACVQLDAQGHCRLFGQAQRPAVCSALRPSQEMCGDNRTQAMHRLTQLEAATAPTPKLTPVPSQNFA